MPSQCRNALAAALLGMALPTVAFAAPGPQPMNPKRSTVEASLNGLAIRLDADTGGILRMRYAGVKMLESKPDRSSILDLAYPVKEFEPLRLASRFSHGAKIDVTKQNVTIHWATLGMSRVWTKVEGDVAATVTMKAAPDGRSVIMTCTVENNSKNPVRQ